MKMKETYFNIAYNVPHIIITRWRGVIFAKLFYDLF